MFGHRWTATIVVAGLDDVATPAHFLVGQYDRTSCLTLPRTSRCSVAVGNPCVGFAARGTGTIYGSTAYGAADANTLRVVALNQSAITAIFADQGGFLLIGDRATSATLFDPAAPNQLVYEHSGPQNLTRLVITTAQVPEPATIPLLGVAMRALVGRCS